MRRELGDDALDDGVWCVLPDGVGQFADARCVDPDGVVRPYAEAREVFRARRYRRYGSLLPSFAAEIEAAPAGARFAADIWARRSVAQPRSVFARDAAGERMYQAGWEEARDAVIAACGRLGDGCTVEAVLGPCVIDRIREVSATARALSPWLTSRRAARSCPT